MKYFVKEALMGFPQALKTPLVKAIEKQRGLIGKGDVAFARGQTRIGAATTKVMGKAKTEREALDLSDRVFNTTSKMMNRHVITPKGVAVRAEAKKIDKLPMRIKPEL